MNQVENSKARSPAFNFNRLNPEHSLYCAFTKTLSRTKYSIDMYQDFSKH